MSIKQMCLFLRGYMINHNSNEDETDHMKWIDLGPDMDTNIVNIKYLGMKTIPCIKQHQSNIWSSIYEKVKQHWVEK